ncbi:MAG: AMP-binding protein, partial [candidate division NC10 bacterium]
MTPPRTVDEVFVAAAGRDAAAVHLILPDGRSVRYGETLGGARRIAGELGAAGIGPGDRVAAFMRTSRELHETYIACGLAGAIAV